MFFFFLFKQKKNSLVSQNIMNKTVLKKHYLVLNN